MPAPRPRKILSLALGLGVLACLWVYFAPVALGGSTSYVVTEGISMEPRFHTGDLAVVRTQSDYHVGEIVAYYSNEFHTVVLHRIIGRAGSHFVFKGDNNNFVDFEHPARSQLIGALWLHLPGIGGTLESIRSPALVGGLAALGMLLLAGGVFTKRRRRRRRQARADAGGARAGRESAPRPKPPQRSLEPIAGVLALLALALVPFLVIALVAFTRPSSKPVPFAVSYEQSGTLSYTAHAPSGPTYASGTAVTGEPLFTRVLHTAELRFAYELTTREPHTLAGTASMYAEIESTSGWRTSLPLGHPLHFHGTHAVLTAPLDLYSVEALVQSVQLATGVGGAYSLKLTPRVSIAGTVSAHPLHTTFSPPTKFALSPLELQPVVAATGAAPQEHTSNPFTQSKSGSLTGKRAEPLSLSFGVAHIAVATARAIALIGIALVIVALIAVLAFLRPQGRDEADTIRSRYARYIVPVSHVAQLPGVAVIDVADMDSLVRIAEHYDRSVLHESTDDGDAFWVTDESGQFRYAPRAVAAEQALAAEPEVATKPHAVLAEPQAAAAEPQAIAAEPQAAAAPEAVAAAPQEALVAEPESEPEESHTIEFEPVPLEAALPNANSVRNGYQNSDENSHANSVRNGYQNSDENSHANGVRNGYQNSDENSHENGVRNGYQNSDENSHENGVRNGYQNSDENGHANGVRNGYQNSDENAPAEEPFAGVFVVPEPSAAREGEVAEEPYTAAFAPRESLAEEVYADEIELGAIGYGASRNGSAKRSKTSPSLPVSTGSSG